MVNDTDINSPAETTQIKRPPQPQEKSKDSSPWYEIFSILRRRKTKRQRHVLVKWAGSDETL